MQISVTARHGEVSQGIREHAAKKLKKLERLLPKIESVQITEAKERAWYIVEITLVADGLLVRGQERAEDMRTAIDLVVDKLERQVKKYRGKLNDRFRHHGTQPPPVEEEAEEQDQPGQIVRSKRFDMKPMKPEEAAAEMELLGHDFYVFINAESDVVNVIYRRRDGNYGLIEPEF
ncbi:MAG: ribosome-associated translation inhibitor RaiA [Armatimonadetes bacterium]|nr:ribosome-associated translation inhibitor RaiA [Armatimonadota bacterium]NIM22856.1 ribosome-associated translation inhibitor RaiA [Armatimonadota bacterium]NIM66722.1 ribosome-associated translation inhibitor RaiA [Armatimonadota bacterium]NIM75279.1 ribosome-associated translation inhibitor RaiA [Armatimonadota bacterium]NIN04919.1 ribosome-associated translation inhibitor RaiA [Armatimonadota bacterium]